MGNVSWENGEIAVRALRITHYSLPVTHYSLPHEAGTQHVAVDDPRQFVGVHRVGRVAGLLQAARKAGGVVAAVDGRCVARIARQEVGVIAQALGVGTVSAGLLD